MDKKIICAAMRQKESGVLILGPRHFDRTMHDQLDAVYGTKKPAGTSFEQGFIDQFGRFYTREAACVVVENNGQELRSQPEGGILYSEDLY